MTDRDNKPNRTRMEHCSEKPQQDPVIPMQKAPNETNTKTIHISEVLVEPAPVKKDTASVPVEVDTPAKIHQNRKGSTNSIASTVARGTTLLCYRMSDVAVALCILLPLTIAIWRGIWELMNLHNTPWWVSAAIGNTIPFTLYYFQESIKRVVTLDRMNFVVFYIISRILLFAHGFGSINQWRGLWEALDHWVGGTGAESAIISMLTGMLLLIGCRAWCNSLAIPLFVGVDEATSVNDCQLTFKTPVTSRWKYLADVFWSTIVIQNLVVLAWRGLWNLATLFLYPKHEVNSTVASLVIGSVITIVLASLQPCYFQFMIKLQGFMRLGVFDLVTTWAFIACVLTWRGTWDMYNWVKIFDEPNHNEWFLVVIGTVGAILLGCLSTVATRGITLDGEDSGDGTSEWPISYVSLLQKKRHHGIPFPEPWILRYFCTSQRMRMTEPLTQRRRSSVGATTGAISLHLVTRHAKSDEEIPTKLVTNSIYVDHFDSPNSKEVKGHRHTSRLQNDGNQIC